MFTKLHKEGKRKAKKIDLLEIRCLRRSQLLIKSTIAMDDINMLLKNPREKELYVKYVNVKMKPSETSEYAQKPEHSSPNLKKRRFRRCLAPRRPYDPFRAVRHGL